jgi:hypothetical protein
MKTNARRGRQGPRGRGGRLPWPRAFRFAGLTALAGFLVALPSQTAATRLGVLVAGPVLLAIVGLGILSDMIGVAATRAEETPFSARAAKRRPGAREGLFLVRHADLVATVASDVVGDLAGTVSGAMLAVLVVDLPGDVPLALRTAIAVGLLTGVTIGAKAIGKAIAVRRADAIVQAAGYVLHLLKTLRRRPGRR